MRQTRPLPSRRTYNKGLHFLSLLLWLFSPAASSLSAAENTSTLEQPGAIVVTIKPLYSLVANLTDGITTPVLLMNETQSPHHYSMRPSERRLLEKARMIVWIGPQMETSLSKIIQQQKKSAVVSAIQADGLRQLDKRKKHNHDEQHHDQQQDDSSELDRLDPHIWLSSHNAIAISRQISQQLIALDPENAGHYQQNQQRLLNRIAQTTEFVSTALKDRDEPFITFHDAFQYFEDENHLNYANSINFDEETGTSLKHVRRIKSSMEEQHIQCLVYQEPKPAIIDALTRHTAVKAAALDPLGLDVKQDKEAWFELMRQLATDFNRCLTPPQ